MSNGEAEQTDSLPSILLDSRPPQPLLRKSVYNLLIGTMFGLGALAFYWDDLTVWRRLSHTRELFLEYRDLDALQLLRNTLRSTGDHPEIALQLARAHRRLGDLRNASLLADSAKNLGAANEKVALEHKLIAVQSGQIRGFEKEFSKLIVESADNSPDVFQAYILGLFANLRTDEAFGLLSGWESSSPSDPEPVFLQAYLLHGINRLPLAAEAYRKGLKLAPYMTSMRRHLARVLFESGEYPAARTELEICRKQDSKDVEASSLLAQCAFAENDLATALAEVDRVLDSVPDHLEARRLRGQIYLTTNEYQSALSDLLFVSERQPDDLVAREALGRALQLLGRPEEAKIHLDFVSSATKEEVETGRLIRKVLSEPKNAELRFEIGLRLLQFGSPEDGAKWLRTVLEIEPNHRGAHLALANYYQLNGDLANAQSHRQQLAGSGEAEKR